MWNVNVDIVMFGSEPEVYVCKNIVMFGSEWECEFCNVWPWTGS